MPSCCSRRLTPTPQGSRSVHQLAPGVFTRIGDRESRQPANTSWVEFRQFVVVIEANTPWGIRAVLPEIRKTTSKPIRYVFDTHYHWDHTQGNSVMADEGVTVVCSQDCASELAVKGKGEWDQMSKRTGEYSLAPFRLQQPSVVFGDFMAIDDGERRLELRRVGPAHTIGDAVAFLPAEGILFTGDLCVNWRSGNNVGDRDADHPHWCILTSGALEGQTSCPATFRRGGTLRAQRASSRPLDPVAAVKRRQEFDHCELSVCPRHGDSLPTSTNQRQFARCFARRRTVTRRQHLRDSRRRSTARRAAM